MQGAKSTYMSITVILMITGDASVYRSNITLALQSDN